MLSNHLRDFQTDENNNPKSKEYLLVKPSRELNFLHLKNKYVADLNLFNRKDESVLYKVRTTAAKSYVVVPNIGIIPPNGSVAIKVYMPKSKEQVRDRMSDKFLVQAFIYKGNHLYDDVVVLNQTFDHYYKTLTSKDVQNTKLKVYFDSHTVIEEEISEDGTPATRNYSPFRTPKPENLDSNMKNLRESYLSSSANAQQPSQVLMAMSPEPDSSTLRGTKNDYNNLSKILPDDSLRASVNMSDAGSYRHTEPEPRRFSGVLEKPREQDVFAASYRDMDNMSVARSLREELEKENKKASLANITNSYRREPNSNDVSIHTEFSDVRSDISVTEQLTAYKRRLQKLEDKFNEQHALINQLTQEKERYRNEAQSVRRGSASLSTTADESKQDNQPRRLDVWHIMILCVVCMILGSLFR